MDGRKLDSDPALSWQTQLWDTMAGVYSDSVDVRFVPVIDHLMTRARLRGARTVWDIGTGTGSVALRAAALVPDGEVVGLDLSADMLAVAAERGRRLGATNLRFVQGRAEELPAEDESVDRLLASLSLMYVLDRPQAAREFARVLKPGGRLVAAFWAGPDECDIVRFQALAGSFAPKPPAPDVGPGSMADGQAFIAELQEAGLTAELQTETTGFAFDSFEHAWATLAGVTIAGLPEDRIEAARSAVRDATWPADGGPCYFRNLTQYVIASKQ
jgi:SAM-dependent methyltransferase